MPSWRHSASRHPQRFAQANPASPHSARSCGCWRMISRCAPDTGYELHSLAASSSSPGWLAAHSCPALMFSRSVSNSVSPRLRVLPLR